MLLLLSIKKKTLFICEFNLSVFISKNSILSNCQLLANLPIFAYLYNTHPKPLKRGTAFLRAIITVIIFIAASLTFRNAE